MNYVFFGTPEFAAIILEKLIKAGLTPTAVVCNPDKPIGRKKIITPPPTKTTAEKYNIKVYQPIKLEIKNWESEIRGADFGIVTAYGKIIPKKIIDTFPKGLIGVHPSLLPKYRGAAPIQNVILNGEKETGISLFLIDEQMDHGPVLEVRKQKIENNDNYESLHDKLAALAGNTLIEIIPKFLKGEYILKPQNDKQATYTKKITIDDAYVDLEKDDPALIERKIRALNPEPGVWTYTKTLRRYWEVQPPKADINAEMSDLRRVKILEAVLTPDGRLKLGKIQFEGKKPQLVQ